MARLRLVGHHTFDGFAHRQEKHKMKQTIAAFLLVIASVGTAFAQDPGWPRQTVTAGLLPSALFFRLILLPPAEQRQHVEHETRGPEQK